MSSEEHPPHSKAERTVIVFEQDNYPGGNTVNRRELLSGVTGLATAAFIKPLVAQTKPDAAPRRGGVMNIAIQPEPPSLVLGLLQNSGVILIGGKIYSGLLTYDSQLTPLPSLAERYEISDDRRTYTFHLRPNAKWHDGTPVTSADVLFTTTVFLPETHPRARENFARVKQVTAPTPHTIVFELKEPFEPFIFGFEVSSAPIMPKHIYEGTNFRTNPANARPIGTGPFKFEKWVKGSYIHLVRHDDYWEEGKPYLDGIYFKVIPDAALREASLEGGEIDLTSLFDVPYSSVARLGANPALQMTTKGYEFLAHILWLEINNSKPLLNDKRFHQAISYALDRDYIRRTVFFGLGRIACGPINSVTKYFEPNLSPLAYDPSKAEALLDEMGLKKRSDGTRTEIEMTPMPYGEVWTQLAEYCRQALSRVGIKVTLRPTDLAGYVQAVSNGTYSTTFNFLAQYADPALGVSRSYVSSNIRKGVMYSNTAQYSNPAVDELFAKGAAAATSDDRRRYYSEVQKTLVDEMPVVWLMEMEYPTFINRKFSNVITTALGINESFADVFKTA